MEKVRRAVAIEVESPPLELQTAARGVYHPWVGRLPLSLGGGPRGVGRPVGFMHPRLPRAGDLLLVHAKTYAASGRRLLLATEE